jgi:hypothetical protein
MPKKENRISADETLYMAIARIVFIKWMKSRGEWGGYLRHLKKCPEFFNEAWRKPENIESFLGRCGYNYNTYIDWIDYCSELHRELTLITHNFVHEYESAKSR